MWIVDRPTRSFVKFMGHRLIGEAATVTVGPKRMAPKDSGNTQQLQNSQSFTTSAVHGNPLCGWLDASYDHRNAHSRTITYSNSPGLRHPPFVQRGGEVNANEGHE